MKYKYFDILVADDVRDEEVTLDFPIYGELRVKADDHDSYVISEDMKVTEVYILYNGKRVPLTGTMFDKYISSKLEYDIIQTYIDEILRC